MLLAAVQPGSRMVVAGIVLLALTLALVLAAYFIGLYNELIAMRHECDEEWADLAALLDQRHEELLKLIDACKGCMHFEPELLRTVDEARKACLQAKTPEQHAQADGQLAAALSELFTISENYPGLKADPHFNELRGRIMSLEQEIASKRAAYNVTANAYNTRIAQVPANFVASLVGFEARAVYSAAQSEPEDADVSFA